MTDPTPTPEPTPAAKTRTPGVANKKQQASVALAEQVTTAAAKDDYAGTLENEHEIAPAFIAQLAGDCATARGGLGQVVENAVAKIVATGGKTGTQQALKRAIRQIQAAAKQKYAGSQPLMLKDYYIGRKIDASQQALAQVGTAILDKISPPEGSTADVLPGVTAGKIAALSGAVDAYTAAWSAQATATSDKAKGQFALATLFKSIDSRRRIVQFAVDGEWSYDVAANAPIRREFGLPANRPFVATVKVGPATSTAPSAPASVKRKPVRAVARVKPAGKTLKTGKRRKNKQS